MTRRATSGGPPATRRSRHDRHHRLRHGNLRSVQKAFEHVGAAVAVTRDPKVLLTPRDRAAGRRSVRKAMDNLRAAGLVEGVARTSKPANRFWASARMQLLPSRARSASPKATLPRGLGVLPAGCSASRRAQGAADRVEQLRSRSGPGYCRDRTRKLRLRAFLLRLARWRMSLPRPPITGLDYCSALETEMSPCSSIQKIEPGDFGE